ncbi:MAG: hypothetical protein IJR77_04915 [Bacteroidales bacterium]|nr:hypothetical protein [Bacteroidales bacterium]
MAEETKDVAAQQEKAVAVVDYTKLPDLSKAEPEPLEMSGEYWTPEKEGETRRLFFVGLAEESVLDMETGENRPLLVVRFAENTGGTLHVVRNGSRRLVGIFEQFQNTIQPGDAFEVTYLGKRKNQNNQFKSDNWSVKRLILKK